MKVIQIDNRVEIYDDEGELIGECEAYELDAICEILDVDFEEQQE